MKKYGHLVCIISAVFLLFACKNSSNPILANAGVNSTVYIDSLQYLRQMVYFEQIDSPSYLNLHSPASADTEVDATHKIDASAFRCYDTLIHRPDIGPLFIDTGKVFVLKLNSGDSVKYYSSMWSFLEKYERAEQIPGLNCYMLTGNDADGDFCMLVDKNTGKVLWRRSGSAPLISPDHKLLCCYDNPCNGIPAAGTTCAQLAFYSAEKDSVKPTWMIDALKWKPVIKWFDNQTLYMKITHYVEDGKGNPVLGNTYFVKMKLPVFEK